MPDDVVGGLRSDRGDPGPAGRTRRGLGAPGGRTLAAGPLTRALPRGLLLLRGVAGAALLALAFSAIQAGDQRSPLAILLPAAGFLGLALLRPSHGIGLAVVAVPLVPVAGNLLSGPWLAPAELLLLVLAAAVLARPAPLPPSPLVRALAVSTVAMAAGAVAATLSALAPPELLPALADLARSLFSPGLDHAALPLRAALVYAAGLLGVLTFRRAAATRGPESLLRLLIAGLAGVGLYSVVEASTGLKLWPETLYEPLSRGMRVPATLPDYNATGAALALGLFPAVALARSGKGAARLGWGLAAASILAGLLLSGSRGAWLAVGLAAVAAVFGAWRAHQAAPGGERLRLLLSTATAVGLAALALALWPGEVGQLLRSRAATLLRPADALHSVQAGRVGFWTAGARMVTAHPLAGVGPGRVPSRFAEYCDEGFPVDVENLHSYPLQAIAENGLPGGLLVLFPFIPLAGLAVRALTTGATLGAPLLALAPGLLAFALTGLGAHPWLLPELQLLFWGAAALLSAAAPAPGPRRLRATPGWLPWALVAVWALPRLVLSPGAERGRFGHAEWGSRSAEGRFFWTGPNALVPVLLPGDGERFLVRVRAMLPDVEARPIRAAVRLDGGPWSRVLFVDQEWQEVPVQRGPRRGAGPEAGARSLLGLEASRGFCPAREGGTDRRLLALQLAREPLRPQGEAVP